MRYADLKKQARKKQQHDPKMTDSPQNKPASPNTVDDDIEELVKDKFKGIKEFYDDIKDPNNIVPNRDAIRKSLNDLLLVEEKVKYNDMILEYEKKITDYKLIIESFIKIIEALLNING